MKLKNQVTSLHWAEKLKQTGYEQEGVWWWTRLKHGYKYGLYLQEQVDEWKYYDYQNQFVAPTATEGLEKLPDSIKINNQVFSLYLHKRIGIDLWEVFYAYEYIGHKNGQRGLICWRMEQDKKLVDAVHKMWLYLKENNLLEGDKG